MTPRKNGVLMFTKEGGLKGTGYKKEGDRNLLDRGVKTMRMTGGRGKSAFMEGGLEKRRAGVIEGGEGKP